MNNDKIEEIISNIDLNSSAPAEEPMRQYYYMAKCREQLKQEAAQLGRKLTACVNTFGCQMNVVTEMA